MSVKIQGLSQQIYKHFPIGYFKAHQNQKDFLLNLGKQLGFAKQDDWYKLSVKSIKENGGKMLLYQYDGKLASVVMGVFPEEPWRPYLFQSKLDWENSLKSQYMEYLYHQLGYHSMDDWYKLSGEDILAHNGCTILRKYGNSPSRMVMEMFPAHPWQLWKFAFPPRGIWHDRDIVRQYLEYLGKQLGYKSYEDWYRVTAEDFRAHHGEPLLAIHGGSPAHAVMHGFSEHSWLPFQFRGMRRRFVKYFRELEQHVGIQQLDEWYKIDRIQMASIKKQKNVESIKDFVASVLKVAYPEHTWELEKFVHFSKLSTQNWLKEVLARHFPDREVIENYVHPLQFFPDSGDVMTVDVFIPSLGLAFDYNGEFHYKQSGTSRSVIERQKLDAIKKAEFEKAGYKFVVVPCWWDGTMASLLPNIPTS